MAKKEELQKQATELGLDWNEGMKVADLDALIAEKQGDGVEGSLTRRRHSRGSTRRVTRGLDRFNKELDAFIKEMDMQFYIADADGKRLQESDLVKGLKQIKQEVTAEVTEMLNPTDDE